jgi:cell wall-associated NlpC family hydrolase
METSETTERAALVAAAREWLGTPYHHLGDVKGVGVDCAMFLVRVFVDAGLVAPFDPRPYPVDWHLHRGEERYLAAVLGSAREVAEPMPGDIALYRFGRTLSHSALVVSWPRVIHALIRVGCIEADATRDEPLASRIPRFFSLWSEGL